MVMSLRVGQGRARQGMQEYISQIGPTVRDRRESQSSPELSEERVPDRSHAVTAPQLLSLQRHIGNHATTRLTAQREMAPAVDEIRHTVGDQVVQRHSSWEHKLIGDLSPTDLATLGTAYDHADQDDPDATVAVGNRNVSRQGI